MNFEKIYFLLFSIATWSIVHSQVQSNVPQCKGVFDFYFVLDSSGSVGNKFQTEIIPFVKNVSSNFVKLSFVTFASAGIVHLNLTSDRNKIAMGTASLQRHQPGGNTRLATGLKEVNKQIDKLGGDTASVILILTDGKLSDEAKATSQALLAREKGASIFAIGIANANFDQLLKIVDNKKEVFIGGDFQFLPTIINQVVNDTCIEILSADPVNVCTNQDGTTVKLTGQGFTNSPNPNATACRFLFNATEFEITKPVGVVERDTIVCEVPNFKVPQNVLLQVTLNGISYISSNVTMYINDCQQVNAGLATGLTFFFLALIILLALILLWFFFPLITGKIIIPPSNSQPDPEKAEPKKWSTVDASYYGGRGAGGIKPLTVHWGDKGATLEGNKLTAAQNANIIESGEEPSTTTEKSKPSCIASTWNAIKIRLMLVYVRVSLIRPVRGSKGTIVWFPSSHLSTQHTSTYQSSTNNTVSNKGTTSSSTNRIRSSTLPTHHQSVNEHKRSATITSTTSGRRTNSDNKPPARPPPPVRPPPPKHIVSSIKTYQN